MSNSTTQIKFTIDSGIVSAFKARCASEGISMTSVIRQWMGEQQPVGYLKLKTSSRPKRRKAVSDIVSLLNEVLVMEERYRDSIPEQFPQRYECSDRSCEYISEAIDALKEAFCQ
jgi:hypothetical protein